MSSLRNNYFSSHPTLGSQVRDAFQMNGFSAPPIRSRSPNGLQPLHLTTTLESDPSLDDDPKLSVFCELIKKSERRFETLFGADSAKAAKSDREGVDNLCTEVALTEQPENVGPSKRPARVIDEDDYGDEDSGDEEDTPASISPLKAKSTGISIPPGLPSTPMRKAVSINSMQNSSKGTPIASIPKPSEDIRKKLEEDKKTSEAAAKRSFHTEFHTLEDDRSAMLDQKRLEESDRQADVETGGTGGGPGVTVHNSSGNCQQGTLSQTNLGASSLTLRHLIARIDAKRSMVQSSDTELRHLMSEVRKGRGQFASEDKIGQEELYDAAQKVLNELRAMTEHSSWFLTRVNKREAPDYYNGTNIDHDSAALTNI